MTRVVLAEDDPAIAEPLARALGREGYDVVVSGTGQGWPDLLVAAIMALLAIWGSAEVFCHARRDLAAD